MDLEALEAFKKFVQHKGLPQKDIVIPVQTGKGMALPVSPTSPSQVPSYHGGNITAVTCLRDTEGPLWVFVAEWEPQAVMRAGPLSGASLSLRLFLHFCRKMRSHKFPHVIKVSGPWRKVRVPGDTPTCRHEGPCMGPQSLLCSDTPSRTCSSLQMSIPTCPSGTFRNSFLFSNCPRSSLHGIQEQGARVCLDHTPCTRESHQAILRPADMMSLSVPPKAPGAHPTSVPLRAPAMYPATGISVTRLIHIGAGGAATCPRSPDPL